MFCEHCKKDYSKKNWARHCDTSFHRKCVNDKDYASMTPQERRSIVNKKYYLKKKSIGPPLEDNDEF